MMDSRKCLSRRDFLKFVAGAGASALIAACGPPATPNEQAAGTDAPTGGAASAAPTVAIPATLKLVEITVVGRAVTIPTILKLGEKWAKDAGIKVTPLE